MTSRYIALRLDPCTQRAVPFTPHMSHHIAIVSPFWWWNHHSAWLNLTLLLVLQQIVTEWHSHATDGPGWVRWLILSAIYQNWWFSIANYEKKEGRPLSPWSSFWILHILPTIFVCWLPPVSHLKSLFCWFIRVKMASVLGIVSLWFFTNHPPPMPQPWELSAMCLSFQWACDVSWSNFSRYLLI